MDVWQVLINVVIMWQQLNEVKKFVYLGSVVNKDGGTDEDIKTQINKARPAFNTLRPIWKSSALSLHNKIRIWLRNTANYQVKHPQAADLYQQMLQKHLQHQVARRPFQRRPLGQD